MEEVEKEVMEMSKGKFPGQDNFTTDFFQACWSTIKHDVWALVEEYRKFTNVLPSLDTTLLAFIPKEEKEEDPSKFKPISLCNVVYKIITKVIENHLKLILPYLISLEKTNYVEGCQILDGIILVHEMIHSLKNTKSSGMLMKLDMSKAFDKISWKYIQCIIRAFGFFPTWVKWIMSLTSSAFFSILFNGSPSHGIHQGDPLSHSFLF
jgi:hypothetical protein